MGITRGGVANALDRVCVTLHTVPAPVSKQLPETLAEQEGGKTNKLNNYTTHYWFSKASVHQPIRCFANSVNMMPMWIHARREINF